MRKLLVIGIGTGNPEHITIQGVKALNRVDVFFVMDKGEHKGALTAIRRDICARYIEGHTYRFVMIEDPVRDPAALSYREGVDTWHRARAASLARLMAEELTEDQTGGLLVWGDPSLYDSTLRIVDMIAAEGSVAFAHEVIPGITSVQALAAAHRTPLNHIGGAVHITTGRRLRDGETPDADNIVVMLDGPGAFADIDPTGVTVHWGAYLGTEREMLIAGPLHEKAAEIARARSEAREAHGWIMDIYLLRRRA